MARHGGALTDSARYWDAAAYNELADHQEGWGRSVLERLELSGDEVVLDAGCGSGRVTKLIAERLPRGRVIGVDASKEMIEFARGRLGNRVELHCSDLLELELDAPVDVIFSNATFHWIDQQQLLYDKLASLLHPDGVLEAQCGAIGNIAELERVVDAASDAVPFAPYLRGMERTWNFVGSSDTQARLQAAGFSEHRTWLDSAQVKPREPHRYLRTVFLRAHVAALPEELEDRFIEEVLGGMPRPFALETVRLNVSARR